MQYGDHKNNTQRYLLPYRIHFGRNNGHIITDNQDIFTMALVLSVTFMQKRNETD